MEQQEIKLDTSLEETLVCWGGERNPVYMTAEQAAKYIEICRESDVD
jgi:hypothetical protein